MVGVGRAVGGRAQNVDGQWGGRVTRPEAGIGTLIDYSSLAKCPLDAITTGKIAGFIAKM
jgi:hypothetical protein